MKRKNIVYLPAKTDDDKDYFIRLTNSPEQRLRREEKLRSSHRMAFAQRVLEDSIMFLLGAAAALAAMLIVI